MNPSRRRPRPRLGWTLIEVVVALGLLVVLLLGLAAALTSARSVDALARERLHATLRASSIMDELAATPWAQLPARDGLTFDVTTDGDAGAHDLLPGGGRARAGLVELEVADGRDLVRARVSVVFRSRATGSDVRVELVSLLGRR